MSKRMKITVGLGTAIVALILLAIGILMWAVAVRYDLYYRSTLLAHAQEVFPQAKPSLIYWSDTDSADLFVSSHGYTATIMVYRPGTYTPPDLMQRVDSFEEDDLREVFGEAVPRWRESLGDAVDIDGSPFLPMTGPLFISDGSQWWSVWVEFTDPYTDEDVALAAREISELIRRARRK